MRRIKQIGVAVAALLAVLAYVWVAAVRAVPSVRRRKAELRASRRTSAGS